MCAENLITMVCGGGGVYRSPLRVGQDHSAIRTGDDQWTDVDFDVGR
jgi:hypothetical protein